MRETVTFCNGQWRQFTGRRHWESLIGQTYQVKDPSKDRQVRVNVLTAFTTWGNFLGVAWGSGEGGGVQKPRSHSTFFLCMDPSPMTESGVLSAIFVRSAPPMTTLPVLSEQGPLGDSL